MKAIIGFLLLLIGSGSLQAQQKVRFPAWIFNTDSTTIYGVSVGWMHTDKIDHVITNGVRVEALGVGILLPLIPKSPIDEDTMRYQKVMKAPIGEIINGINLSPLGHGCNCAVNGLNLYGFGSIIVRSNGLSSGLYLNAAQFHNGLQVAGMANITYHLNGAQVSAIGNGNHGLARGAQISILGNHSRILHGLQVGIFNGTEKTAGAQAGLVNISDHLRGVQLGLYNKSKKSTRGVQIGLWNVNEKRKLPLVNW